MPRFNNPQAPSRVFYRPQVPQTTIDIGGSDNNDIALMLALIDMLNRTEDREERSALDRDLFELQKQSMEQQSQRAERGSFDAAADRLGSQIPEFRKNRDNTYASRKKELTKEVNRVLTEGTNAPGMKRFTNDLGRLRTMGGSEARRFLDTLPERIEGIVGGLDEPLARLSASREVDAAIRAYAGVDERGLSVRAGELHSRPLWETYQDRLSGVEQMAKKALTEAENMLTDLDSQWSDFMVSQEQGVRNAIGKARSEGYDVSSLGKARRLRSDMADPAKTPFQPKPYEVEMFPVRASRKDVETGRVAETVSGAPEIIAERTEGAVSKAFRLPGILKKVVSGTLGGAERRRGETEFEVAPSLGDVAIPTLLNLFGFGQASGLSGLGFGVMPFEQEPDVGVPSFLQPNPMGPPEDLRNFFGSMLDEPSDF